MSRAKSVLIKVPAPLYAKIEKISAEQGLYINEIIIKAVDLYCRIYSYAKKKQQLYELMKRKEE